MTEHYFIKKPTSKLIIEKIEIEFFNIPLKIKTASGLFSKSHIDKATQILINNAKIKKNSEILDLGCGYGIVGIAISKKYQSKKIIFSDINQRAVMITKENCKLNNIKNYKVIQSDIYENIKKLEIKFDTILLNPPQTAGKDICIQMINQSKKYLKPSGTLQIVARHNKGGKTLSKEMENTFGNVETLAKKGGVRVYLSYKEV